MENLLRWAQLQTGSMAAEVARIEVARMVHTAIALANSTARHKSINFSVDICADLRAIGDREMTGTILRNLLSNAVKFTYTGGSIALMAYRVENRVRIEVADSGVGMTEEQLERIFDIGSKQSTPGTSGERGTGLGLILCRDLAREQDGTLSVMSSPDIGTTVVLELPADGDYRLAVREETSETGAL
jgi:two-component system, sensor histidine kinase and response regulator